MAKIATYSLMRSDILKKSFKPIYLFMGEESFFIDDLTDLMDKTILSETERDFNQSVFYGVDSYDNKIPAFISSYYKDRGFQIDAKSTQMLVDYVGNDLSKLVMELEKLQVVLSGKPPRITAEIVEENVGISKDYNNFELIKAIANKDRARAYRIVNYFDKDQKTNPLVMTISLFIYFFNNLVECFWLPRKTEEAVMKALNFRNTFMTQDYMAGLRNYTVNDVMQIISHLRTFDARSKGIDNPPYTTNGELLKELVSKIMN